MKLLDTVKLRSDASEPGTPPWGGTVPAGALGTIVDELSDRRLILETSKLVAAAYLEAQDRPDDERREAIARKLAPLNT